MYLQVITTVCGVSSPTVNLKHNWKQGSCTPRSLESLKEDYKEFKEVGGGLLKNTKHHNNSIQEYFFDMSLENAYLHNTLKSKLLQESVYLRSAYQVFICP